MFKKQALFADAENQGNKNKENNKNNNTQTRCRRRKKKRKNKRGLVGVWWGGEASHSGVQLDSTPTGGGPHNPSKNLPPCTHHNLWTKHAVIYRGRVQTLCLALTTGGGWWDCYILISAVFFLHHQCHWWKGSIQFCSMLPSTLLFFSFKILQDLSLS